MNQKKVNKISEGIIDLDILKIKKKNFEDELLHKR